MKGLIFTYLLTYGGAVIALFNPFTGFLIYVAFAILKPESLWYWAVPEGNYSRIVAIALLAGWCLNGFGSWRLGKAWGIVVALIGYWIWSIISALDAPDSSLAFAFVEALSKIVLPFLVGITTINSTARLKQLAWVIILTQGFVAYEFNLSYYQGFNRVKEVGFAGMEEGSVSIGMVAGAGVALFQALHPGAWWQRLTALTFAMLMVHVPMLAASRGGMLGLIVTAVVGFVILPKRPQHYFWFLVAVLLGLRLAGPEVRTRFETTMADKDNRDASAQSRLDLWANCWDAMLKRPVLGVGPDHFPTIVHEYGWPRGKEAHTLWLQIGAELGFPGLVALAMFYGLCIVRLLPYAWEHYPVPDPWLYAAARMVVAGLIGFVVAAQFISLEGLEIPYYIALLGAGVLRLSSTPMALGINAAPRPLRGLLLPTLKPAAT